MFKKITPILFMIVVSLLCGALNANAQVVSVPDPSANAPDSVIVSFPGVIKQIDGITAPTAGMTVPSPAIFFGQGGNRKFLVGEATLFRNSKGTAQLKLSNFKTLDNHDVNLVTGSTDDGGVAVPSVAPGGNRTYLITWDSVQLDTQSQPEPVLTSATVGSSIKNPPVLFVNSLLDAETDVEDGEKKFALFADGINLAALLAKFKNNPGRIKVTLNFDKNDPVPGSINNSISDRVVRLEGVRGVVQANGRRINVQDDVNPEQIIVTLSRSLPQRAAAYTVKFEFPTADLNSPGLLKLGFAAPTGEEFVSAASKIEGDAPPTERAKTEFFFESTFSSIVNATSRKRSNVGLFGLHFKPVVGLRFFNVGTSASEQQATPEENDKRRPKWIALRPLLDADVDTQRIKDSQAPNRIVFGADFEYGIAASRKGRSDAIQQYVFLNGVRYDSDRDFKTQTIYWQTEFLPQFLNFEQTRDQRLRQFRFPGGNRDPKKARLFPLVSSYYVRPSIGYQLGGTIKRGNSASGNISRLFVKYGNGVEFRRLIQFSLDDTYYFLQDASRRRNRNYLEARLDFNTGALFNVDLGSLQSAFTIKFQRGDLPPTFKPVNAFSIGFKLYR
jgi:hypothetical protein